MTNIFNNQMLQKKLLAYSQYLERETFKIQKILNRLKELRGKWFERLYKENVSIIFIQWIHSWLKNGKTVGFHYKNSIVQSIGWHICALNDWHTSTLKWVFFCLYRLNFLHESEGILSRQIFCDWTCFLSPTPTRFQTR